MRNSSKSLLRLGTKSLTLIMALALIMCGTIGGTVAWLFDKSDPVINTFTYGDIEIQLNETDPEGNDDPTDNTYSMDINNTGGIFKDPKVTVSADSEKCWLFVKVKESFNFGDYMAYTVPSGEDGWKLYAKVSDSERVYYRIVERANINQVFSVLENDRVYLKSGITQDQLDAMIEEDFPTLTIYAYAVQYSQITNVDEAWAKVTK